MSQAQLNSLAQLNSMAEPALLASLLECCHSHAWAQQLLAQRPYPSLDAFYAAAAKVWQAVAEAEVLAALNAHPKIGDLSAIKRKARAKAEQGQVRQAGDATLASMKALNATYADRFGFTFVICATGKHPDELLEALRTRLGNSREAELVNGRREQGAITALRLHQLLEGMANG